MLKIAASPGGGYLLLTLEGGRQHDLWFASLDEIVADLAKLDIVWGQASGPTSQDDA